MLRWTPRLGAPLLALLICAAPAAADPAPSRVLVRFAASAGASDRAAARESVDGTLEKRLPLVPGLQLVDLPPDASPAQAASDLGRRDGVLYAQPDAEMTPFRTVDDPLFGQQWALNNTGQTFIVAGTADADVDAPEAWDRTLGDPSAVVADIDTGGAWDHPDLSPNVWTNTAEVSGTPGVDNDGNGFIDDVRGWDFLSNDNDPSDFDGHGTGTASIIAARGDNAQAITGIAPNARVMILRAGSSNILVSAAVQAVAYAKAKGARVVNMSFGSSIENPALRDAIINAPNLLFVAAAGNDGANVDTSPVFPCATNAANLVCVGATTSNDSLASFSNRGAVNVDLAAPGQFVRNLKPAVRTLFSDTFSAALAGRWITGGTNNTWERFQTSAGPPPDFALSDSPGTNYVSNTDSFAQRVGTSDTSGAVRECQVAFALTLTTAGPGDVLRAERAPDASFTTPTTIQAFTGAGSGTQILTLPLLAPTLAFRLRFTTDASGVSSGALIDDISADCLKTIGTYDGSEIGFASGTSESAPLVSGAAALLFSAEPALTPTAAKTRLLDSADRIPALAGTSATGGRLNAARLLGIDPPSPAAPPSAPPPAPPVQPTPLPPLVKDTRPPGLTRLQLSRVRFKAGKKSKLTFRLDEAAAVIVTSERLVVRKGVRRWVAETGSIARLLPAGKASLTFKGKLGGRKLPKGTHRLRVRAVDAAGNATKAPPLSFLIVAR